MSLQNYRQLIDQICELTMLPDPASLYEMASISVRGISFSLLYNEKGDSGEVQIYCGFGPLPKHEREPVLLRLLETNLHLCTGPGSPALSYNSETSQVVLVCVLPLELLEAQKLLDLLGYLADIAKQWQSDFFLGDQHTQVPQTAPKNSSSFKRNFNTATIQR